jgi:integrase
MGTTTKSPAGVRAIPLHEHTVQALRAHRLRQLQVRMERADLWHDEDLIFPSAIGALRCSEVVRRHLHRLCAAAGVPEVRLHALRHTCASMLIAQGEHPRATAELLGHVDPSVTLRIYVRASPQHRRLAVDRLGRALEGE